MKGQAVFQALEPVSLHPLQQGNASRLSQRFSATSAASPVDIYLPVSTGVLLVTLKMIAACVSWAEARDLLHVL